MLGEPWSVIKVRLAKSTSMAIKIQHPHDSFIRRSLTSIQVARDLLKAHLAPDMTKRINWDTLQLTNKSFVKDKLTQLHTDVLYKCRLDNKLAYTYCLIEHQSTPDPLLPFRILEYNVSLMREHLEQGHKQLPLIINLCLYAGQASPYPHSTDIYDCFEAPLLARREMFKPLQLIDLTVLSEEELTHHGEADLVEILLKHGVERAFLSWIKANRDLVARLLNRVYGESGVVYILATDGKNNAQELIKAIIGAAPDKSNIIMTAAQQLRQEGIQQGIQQGMEQGIQQGMEQGIQQGIRDRNLEIASNMLLQLHLDIDTVQKATSLSREELEEIQAEEK